MNRRKFLKYGSTVSFSSPFILNQSLVQAFTPYGLLNCEETADRVLVVIQLDGGNDGLNTLVPIAQYDSYVNHRPNIGLAQGSYIELDTTLSDAARVGLHPAMTDFKSLYDQGKAHIIQGVGYPNMNLSHFKSSDLWTTAGDGTPSNFSIDTGWMGRFLDSAYPGLAGNPTPLMPDPLGIQLGSKRPSLGYHTHNINPISINLAGQDPSGFFSIISEVGGAPISNVPISDYGDRLNHIMNVENNTTVYAERISEVFNNGINALTYPDTYLANQLKTIARLISGGCTTKIYLVDLFGFDTHVDQVQSNSPTVGIHANLLTELSTAVKAFQDDLNSLNLENRVMTVTFSEFGRKVPENGSRGTDHGTLAPMFVFGSNVEGGMSGINPDLSNLSATGTLQGYQFDYRQVFTTLVQDWLGGTDEMLDAALLGSYASLKIPFIQSTEVSPPDCYIGNPINPLPVELLSFTAQLSGKREVLLEWQAEHANELEYFELERSASGRDFSKLITFTAKGLGKQFYSHIDTDPVNQNNYYRLKMVDQNQTVEYSEVRQVEITSLGISALAVYPNPSISNAYLTCQSSHDFAASLSVFNSNGQMVLQESVRILLGENLLELNTQNWQKGMHHLSLISEDGKHRQALDLIKQ
ncbi:MAG: DUF1501 domain-containing protein [Bacteroidota bacterium]